ncbi:hypothetical protein KIN20_013689 [Parelaphostrongylus tenuis]|uniref:Uncharacterized protein n=1 Tax=Parelaphostrongylus tenuis TaxID=148309 RepID=A0AAD5QNY1_PARTN|nr:hypothetical protein KIN20_013689 [Parelaphostrongylus tenuis]
MLLVLLGTSLLAAGVISGGCDVASFSEEPHGLSRQVCSLENEVDALKAAVQEILQRTDHTSNIEPAMEKRKNEFIRFGKRSLNNVKRKNEFIRFGKRKNEFIRFGRVDPSLQDNAVGKTFHENYLVPISKQLKTSFLVEKRKNEFIRFG